MYFYEQYRLLVRFFQCRKFLNIEQTLTSIKHVS
jgi:hypothetical protein